MDTASERFDRQSPQRRALLAMQLMKKAGEGQKKPAIPRRDAALPPPLSFAQQRLWFFDQLHPNNATYNGTFACRLDGALDRAALERSLHEIVRRHEVLRARLASVEGRPEQVIAPAAEAAAPLPVVDLQDTAPERWEEDVQRLAMAEARQPFDLSEGVLRMQLLRRSATAHVLLVSMHHIAADGWSFGVFTRELATLYAAFSAGQPAPLAPLPIQYADYAAWQRQWLEGNTLQDQLGYWKRQLAGKLPVLELPADRPRPAVQSFRGARAAHALPASLVESLKALGRQENATLFMTLLAGFQALLARCTGLEDVIVGSPVANRNRAETEGLVGLFVNTLVLRTQLGGNPPLRELIGRVREVCLGAYSHQDLPFERLVEELQPERDPSHTPLFQVMFALQNTPAGTLTLPGLALQWQDIHNGGAKFDLMLVLTETAQGVEAVAEYNTDLFDAATVGRLLAQYQTLLEGMAADADQPLWRVPILPQAERRLVVEEWNATHQAYPDDRCVHQLIEAQAREHPDAIAVGAAEGELSFRELNRRANQLAHALKARGVGPEVRVGICMERSLHLIVGLLAILKAGGAYVPLDPAYPRDRLQFMLEDIAAPVLLAQQRFLAALPPHSAQVLCLDTDWPAIAGESDADPDSGATADHLAYVIYTSGSTGRPKGVQIGHRALLNMVFWHQRAFGITPADRASHIVAPAFDMAVREIWPNLAAGASIHVGADEIRAQPELLRDWLVAQRITVSLMPTPMAESVLFLEWPRDVALRALCPGGAKLHHYAPPSLPFALINEYGPTETTVLVTSGRVPTQGVPGTAPSMGRIIANTAIHILDPHLNPVPIGVGGEIYIAGDSLSRGYLNRPELTAQTFLSDPFGVVPGGRMYKSGDLARWLPDGQIESLGRVDHQVKLRGYRIELGEIESVLGQHPTVREAAVLVREDVPGDQRLIAYVAGQPGEEAPSAAALAGFLKERLPVYMLPSAYVVLDALPLTQHGKVDRRALPAPDASRGAVGGNYVAPRDTLEMQLAQIWEEVLNVRPIGVTDNFFDLGGHSLLSVRLMARIKDVLGRELSLATLFQGATIESLAGILRQGDMPWSPLVAIRPTGTKRPIFCAHPAGGNVICYADLARHMDKDQPFYALQSPGMDGKQKPFESVEEMATCYVEAIRQVQPEGPYLLGGWCFGGIVAFEIAQQLRRQGQEVPFLILLDTYAPLPLAQQQGIDHAKVVSWFARDTAAGFGKSLLIPAEELRRIPEPEQLQYALGRLQAAAVIAPDTNVEQMRRYMDVYLANVKAMGKYEPEPYPDAVTLLRAEEALRIDGTLGWSRHVKQPITIHNVPGNHVSMILEPHVKTLAGQLDACLDEAHRRLADAATPPPAAPAALDLSMADA
jgi:aspartate racemase